MNRFQDQGAAGRKGKQTGRKGEQEPAARLAPQGNPTDDSPSQLSQLPGQNQLYEGPNLQATSVQRQGSNGYDIGGTFPVGAVGDSEWNDHPQY